MPAPSQPQPTRPFGTPSPTGAPVVPPTLRRPPPANVPRIPRPINGQCPSEHILQYTPESPRLRALRRRLERAELIHLRDHAAEQAERIEDLERRLADAEDSADFWCRSHHNLEEHLDDGHCIGLTQQGGLVVVPTGAVQ